MFAFTLWNIEPICAQGARAGPQALESTWNSPYAFLLLPKWTDVVLKTA